MSPHARSLDATSTRDRYEPGAYGRFDAAQDETAYAGVRDLVLGRSVPVSRPIDIDLVADALDVAPRHVHTALIRLQAEQLVDRAPAGEYRPTPITIEIADGMFDARAAIEVGVVDGNIGAIADDDLAELTATADELRTLVAEPMPDLDRFLAASHRYHVHLVGLARCPQLTEAYVRLGIARVWRDAIADLDWWSLFDVTHHSELTRALREVDREGARASIYDHRTQVRQLVRTIIGSGGGSL